MVTPRFFPYTGGVESHVYEVSRRLVALGIHVTVLTTDATGRWPACEQHEGVEIRRVRAWPAQRDYYFAPGLLRHIQTEHWDLIHVQSYHTLVAPLAMAAARRAHIPYVVTFHGGGHSSRVRNALRRTQGALLRPLLSRAVRLVAVAPFEADRFSAELNLPRARFVVIPNGAELPAAQPDTAIHRGQPDVLIASIGRLERYKGHHRLVAALPDILRQVPNARVWIAGVGPYEGELRQLARRLGVADRVEFRTIPAADRQAMANALARAALVVLLSEFETHPIAALEALALGRPLLVACSPGLQELAARGWARSVPLTSSDQAVAAAVVQQVRQPLVPADLVLPSWDQCAADLLDLYRQVV
jgi:glycosyltransferase involved in cell wall biosynthesis